MGYYLLVIGSLLTLFALWSLLSRVRLLVFGARTYGVIVGIDEQMRYGDSDRKKIYFHSIIEFETVDRRTIHFTFGSGSTRKRPTIGNEVRVLYDIESPEKATLNSFMGVWAGPLAAAVLGVGALFGGLRLVIGDTP